MFNADAAIFAVGKHATAKDEWRAHWPIVAKIAFALGSGIVLNVFVGSLFIKGVTQEFGWTRTQISMGSWSLLMAAVAVPMWGRIIDRIGPKPVLIFGILALAAAYCGFAMMSASLTVYFLLNACMAIFASAASAIGYTKIVVSYFDKGRGMALSLATLGIALFATVMPLVLHQMIDAYGWRAGYLVLAALSAGLGLPLVLSLPGDMRVRTGSISRYAGAGSDAAVTRSSPFRSRAFWALLAAIVMIKVAGSALLFHFTPLLTDRGLSGGTAAMVLSTYGFAVFGSRLIGGPLLDLAPARLIAALSAALPALGCLFFLMPGANTPVILTGAILLGVQNGIELDVLPYLVSRHFGSARYSTIYGMMNAALLLSSLAGVTIFGLLRDANGNYQSAILFAAITFTIGAGCFIALGPTPTEG